MGVAWGQIIGSDIASLGLLVLLGPGTALGQTTPVTAKERITDEIVQDGKVIAGNALGQGSVEEIACTWLPTYLLGSDGVNRLVGQHCFSDQYDLDLKEDSTFVFPIKGQAPRTQHLVIEKYDIQIGQEPDPKLFDIKANFTVYRPDPKE